MQTHGVPNFPDPNGQGAIQGSGINSHSPSFEAANQKCQHLLPNGGQPTAAQKAGAEAQGLKFSECMRQHGITDFPDPPSSGSGGSVSLHAGKGSDLNGNLPRFQAAVKACHGKSGGSK